MIPIDNIQSIGYNFSTIDNIQSIGYNFFKKEIECLLFSGDQISWEASFDEFSEIIKGMKMCGKIKITDLKSFIIQEIQNPDNAGMYSSSLSKLLRRWEGR